MLSFFFPSSLVEKSCIRTILSSHHTLAVFHFLSALDPNRSPSLQREGVRLVRALAKRSDSKQLLVEASAPEALRALSVGRNRLDRLNRLNRCDRLHIFFNRVIIQIYQHPPPFFSRNSDVFPKPPFFSQDVGSRCKFAISSSINVENRQKMMGRRKKKKRNIDCRYE